MIDAEILTAIATAPIAGAATPSGESLRYEESWGILEAEVGKLENPGGGEVDWRKVEEGAIALLVEKGKDVLLMAWLARAMWHRDSMPGLAAGIETLKSMLETFWDSLHPQRVRPRRAALEWLGEKLAPVLVEEQVRGHPDETARCLAAIAGIAAWAGDRFEGEDCGLMGFASRLREMAEAGGGGAAAAASGGEEQAAEEVAAAPAGGRAAGPAGPIANRSQAMVRLKELGDWFAKHEPHSPIVPLLRRAESWGKLDFQAVYSELLKNRHDARDHLWDVLGIVDPPPSGG